MYQVFVFGVARPGYNLGRLDYSRYCPAILEGYEMRLVSAYPIIVPGRGKVVGDLVGVNEKGLEFIAEMEGWIGQKEEVAVLLEDGERRDALTFVSSIQRVGLAQRLPSGDWLDSW